jgi:hypothetical protein
MPTIQRTLPRFAAAFAAAMLLASCAEPTAPAARVGATASADDRLLGLPLLSTGTVLRRTTTLASDLTASTTLYPTSAGTLQIPGAGLRVTFPKGSVSSPLTVTVTARQGDRVVYSFEPHGTRFNASITIEQDLRVTEAGYNLLKALDLRGGYVADESTDLLADGTALISELFGVNLSLNLLRLPVAASFSTRHFSGYILASGCSDGDVAR